MASPDALPFVPIGANATRVFGLDARSRACRLAAEAGLICVEQAPAKAPAILANLGFAWGPVWLEMLAGKPGTVITSSGRPVFAHVGAGANGAAVAAAMTGEGPGSLEGLAVIEAEAAEDACADLAKKDRLFVLPLTDETAEQVEQAVYDAAYKGVTDALTLYVWRRPAFYLTRSAAQAGLSPNTVTAAGALLCLLTIYLWWNGYYWLGVTSGVAFMVLDTVDGQLARCTGASSWWGNIFDHAIDLVHPPLWWWAWLHGLGAYGRPLEPVYAANLLAVVVAGHLAQRAIEVRFRHRFGIHIHVWRPLDSRFRLVTAGRNPNMAILLLALLAGRPDVGIELVALWTLLCLVFHAVRLAQAEALYYRGEPVTGWLS